MEESKPEFGAFAVGDEPRWRRRARQLPPALRFLVHPSDEGVIIGLAAFMLWIAANTQTGWLYVVVSLILATLVIGFVMPRLTLCGLQVRRHVASPIVEGENATVAVTVHNPGAWPRFLLAVEDGSASRAAGDAPAVRRLVLTYLPARSSIRVAYVLPCPRRGVVRFDTVSLMSATPFGFFPSRRRLTASGEVVVHPQAGRLPRLRGDGAAWSLAAAGRSRSRRGYSFDFLGIREYHPGDDTRYLHWPSTARTGQLMVREFTEPCAPRIAIVVDTAPSSAREGPDGTLLDEAARLAAAIIKMGVAGGGGVLMVAATEACGVARDSYQEGGASEGADVTVLTADRATDALDWLARLNPRGNLAWGQVLRAALPRLPRGTQVVVLTTESGADLEAQRAIDGGHWSVQVIPVTAGETAASGRGDSEGRRA